MGVPTEEILRGSSLCPIGIDLNETIENKQYTSGQILIN